MNFRSGQCQEWIEHANIGFVLNSENQMNASLESGAFVCTQPRRTLNATPSKKDELKSIPIAN